MFGDEEIVFSGKYKDFDFSARFDLSKADEKDVTAALFFVSEKIERDAYRFSGLDLKKIDEVAKKCSSIEEIIGYLDANPIRKMLEPSISNKKLMPAAESCFFNMIFRKSGIKAKPEIELKLKPEKAKEEGRIGFIGKYKEWTAIKKLSLKDVDEDWEVSGILSGINHTIVNKGLELSCKNYADVEEKARKAAKGRRKSIAAAAEALEEIKGELNSECWPALLTKTLEELKYYIYITPFVLVDAYPDLKPPKTRGRKPKG